MKIRKIIALTLTLVMGASMFVGCGKESASQSSTEDSTSFNDTGLTSVTFRVSLKNWGNYASANVYLYRYASLEDKEQMDEVQSFSIYRNNKWQTTKLIEPGYYAAFTSPNNAMGKNTSCFTSIFEVKGDKMTVYMCNNIDEAIAPCPEQWLVYGEDTQEFYIWGGPEDPDNRLKNN